MHGLRSKEDLDEVKGKLSEAANALEILIPLLQQYMAQQEPENEDAKVSTESSCKHNFIP